MTNGDDQAFPTSDITRVGEAISTHIRPGMTKREFFAAMVMQGILAKGGAFAENIPLYAVRYADHLIQSLNEKTEDTPE